MAALSAEALDFPYEALWPVSSLIYATTAFVAARVGGNALAGLLAGLAVAGTDATLGWALSWAIGPGEPEPDDRGAAVVVATAVTVAASGAAIGLVAGLAGRRQARAS